MTTWSETIILPKPLRNVRLVVLPPPTDRHTVIGQDAIAEGSAAANSQAKPGLSGSPGSNSWQSAYDQGRIDGEKSVSEQLLKQRNETHELFQGILTSLSQSVPQVVRDTENMLVSLALEVAQKLVGNMAVSAEMVEAAIQDALSHVDGTSQVTIRLNPADLETLQNSHSSLLTTGDGGNEFRFLGSPDVTRGGCLVQTRFGTVDARRETKFDLLKRNLFQ
jgi:flagellar assembly protein FliH